MMFEILAGPGIGRGNWEFLYPSAGTFEQGLSFGSNTVTDMRIKRAMESVGGSLVHLMATHGLQGAMQTPLDRATFALIAHEKTSLSRDLGALSDAGLTVPTGFRTGL